MDNAAREKWALTQEAFDGFLTALGPARDGAADRYLDIRRNLVRLFEWRGCPTRMITRTRPSIDAPERSARARRSDVASYCIGVARMLLREMSRDRALSARSLDEAPEPQSPPHEPAEDAEDRTECLRRCLGKLSAENRDLILAYYQGDKGEKIRNRKGLTQLFGLRSSTLRMRALRLRETLQQCSENCLHLRRGNPCDKFPGLDSIV